MSLDNDGLMDSDKNQRKQNLYMNFNSNQSNSLVNSLGLTMSPMANSYYSANDTIESVVGEYRFSRSFFYAPHKLYHLIYLYCLFFSLYTVINQYSTLRVSLLSGNALDDLNLDDALNLAASMDREYETESPTISNSISAGLASSGK